MVRKWLCCAVLPSFPPGIHRARPLGSTHRRSLLQTFAVADYAVCWDRTPCKPRNCSTIAAEFNASQQGGVPIKLEYLGNYGDIFQSLAQHSARELPATAVGYEPMTSNTSSRARRFRS